MTTRHQIAILCALASPFTILVFATIEWLFAPSGFYTKMLWTVACQLTPSLWFLYWISRVTRKGEPIWFRITRVV